MTLPPETSSRGQRREPFARGPSHCSGGRTQLACRRAAPGASPAEGLAQVVEATGQGLLARRVEPVALEAPAVDGLRHAAVELALRRQRFEQVLRQAGEADGP